MRVKPGGRAAKIRLSFDFSPDALDRLEAIKQKAGVQTSAQVVRDALKYYEWLLEISSRKNCELRLLEDGKEVLIKII